MTVGDRIEDIRIYMPNIYIYLDSKLHENSVIYLLTNCMQIILISHSISLSVSIKITKDDLFLTRISN